MILNPLPIREKVLAYITRGDDLLVFDHLDFPEAGTQVPGGSIEPGETPEAAALREAREETGLADLTLVGCLGVRYQDMRHFGRQEHHHRHYFHLACHQPAPESWFQDEGSAADGSHAPIRLYLRWVTVDLARQLLLDEQGAMLDALPAASGSAAHPLSTGRA